MSNWDAPFGGVIGRYHFESTPWWPTPPTRGAESPALAAEGLQFTNFHTTGLCSPTRAALLSGRNHHSVGMGRVTDLATGFPGYHSRIPRSAGFMSEILRDAGWATWAVGKWHLTPEDECHHGATRQRWPLGRGFERFYGFFAGETHQFAPALVCDNHQIEPPGRWADGYHLSEDLADQASGLITDLRAIDVDKPFLLYLAFGACHSPHHAPADFLARERGRFDAGWDEWRERTFARQLRQGVVPPGTRLSPRPEWVPAWSELSADEQRLYARYMEAFAAFLAHADAQLGRVVDTLRQTGDYDRTVIVVMSDNGASSEGGPTGSVNDGRMWNFVPRPRREAISRIDEIGGPRFHNNYPWGWTVAGNTPFRRWKREVHEGGVADPLIVRLPRSAAGIRTQYVHAIDVLPTILDLVRVDAPTAIDGVTQRPIDGISFVPVLDDGDAPPTRTLQYFEMFGCRALYQDGWKAVTYHPIQADEPGLDHADWELYDVTSDPSECTDLAVSRPEHLHQMIDTWWDQAEKYNVLPLDNRPFSDFVLDRPPALPGRRTYRYRPGRPAVPEAVTANIKNRTHTVTAQIVTTPSSEGVVIAQGSLLGGWTLFVQHRRVHYVHNLSGFEQHRIDADQEIEPGRHTVTFTYTKTGEHQGRATLSIDGRHAGEVVIPRFTPVRFSITGAGLTAGRDASGLPVTDDYTGPFPFTGEIVGDVVIEVDGDPFLDPEGEAEVAIVTQ
jgi:arylsulfatase A-like enzyme